MFPWITIATLVVLLQGRFLDAASVTTNNDEVVNEQLKANDDKTKPLRYRRRRILQVEDSPIFKNEAFTFIESTSRRLAGRPNKQPEAGHRASSIHNVVDIDEWSRLLQSDLSMSMPPSATTDTPMVPPTSSPVVSETDVPTAEPPSIAETDEPSVMETDEPTKSPSDGLDCDALNRTDAIRTLLEDITEIPDGDGPFDSPQSMAFDWIANVDSATDPCTDSESTVTRFALATFYYSTNGENWTDSTNWISSTASQCTWYGITCNDDGDVDAFQLGT